MNGDDLEMLFGELDADGDGLVTLEEFLSGLFGAETPRNNELDSIFQHDDDDEKSTSTTISIDSCKKRKLPSNSANSLGRKKVSYYLYLLYVVVVVLVVLAVVVVVLAYL